jgi:dipeptidase E
VTLRLLLLSNSTNSGRGYLEHALEAIREFLGPVRELAFVPYAGVRIPEDEYADRVRKALAPLGIGIRAVTARDDAVAAVGHADAVAIGGGNSFQLLKRMYETGLLEAVRASARAGQPYLGWSAGSNLACPTIRTTNDMPVVQPRAFAALGLVSFQINPHYTNATLPDHSGESRDERIAEFLALNPGVKVIGLREGSWLQVEGEQVALAGPHPARIFESGRAPWDVEPAADLPFLRS